MDEYQKEVDKLNELPAQEKEEMARQSSKKPGVMTIKKGMVIHFHGFKYKCTAARPNGKITLKFMGQIAAKIR